MQIRRVRIRNYRSIFRESVEFGPLTAIVGPNGAGKSAVLRALNEFYNTTRTAGLDDFYNRDQSVSIEISVTFGGLTTQENELYAPYIHSDELIVTKIIEKNLERYHGTRLQDPDFVEIRQIAGKTERKNAYLSLRSNAKYASLPTARSADEAETSMSNWEQENPNQCELTLDDGKFFGFRQVGQARLERWTRFVLVPAVRDAEEDAADSKGSAIYQLMELVVRNTLEQNEELRDFRARVQEEYKNFLRPESTPQLNELQLKLTSILRSYVPSAAVLLDWISGDQISLPTPRAEVRLREDRFEAPVDRVGHGLQRAFILSLLQSLASTILQRAVSVEKPEEEIEGVQTELIPDLILGIEEPELYQHPSRQRHWSKILYQLSTGQIPGVTARTQVIYCTHSPLFVDIGKFQFVRRFHKITNPENSNLPMVTSVQAACPDTIAQQLQSAQDRQPSEPFTGDSLQARLATVMTPIVNEGFFADVVVLVEGEEDRAAILGCAQQMEIDLEGQGFAIIPCLGKTNIDRPFLVFTTLGIPAYVIFDSDSDKCDSGHSKANRSLQRLLGVEQVEDFPKKYIAERFAIFNPNLSILIEGRSGGMIYNEVADKFVQEYGYKRRDDCKKSLPFIKMLLDRMAMDGHTIYELYSIVQQLLELAPRGQTFSATETGDA